MSVAPETAQSADLAAQIIQLARDCDSAGVEEKWPEVLKSPPDSPDFYHDLIKALSNRAKEPELAERLIKELIAELQTREDWPMLHLVVFEAAEIWPDDADLRKPASAALKGLYGDHPNFKQLIGACKGAALDVALRRFEALLQFSPDRVYRHATFGDGIVTALDVPSGKVTIDFPSEKGKVFTFAGVRDFLQYFPPGHIVALRATDPETLQALADDDPVALVKLALEGANGTIKQGDLKALVTGGIIAESSWNSWWNRARTGLALDPLVDFNRRGGAHGEIKLRETPKTLEEEVGEVFLDPESDIVAKAEAAAKLSQAAKAGATIEKAFLSGLLRNAVADYRKSEAGPVAAAQLAFLAEDLRALGATVPDDSIPTASNILAEFTDYEALSGIAVVDHATRALAILLHRDGPEGVARACRILPSAPPKLAQAIWKELDEEHHAVEAAAALRTLFNAPLSNPLTYVWAVKGIIDGAWSHLADHIPLSGLIPDLLDQLDDWTMVVERGRGGKETVAAAKGLISKIRSLLQANSFAPITRAVQEMTVEQAASLRRAIQLHNSFNDAFRFAADRSIISARPELESATPRQQKAAAAAGAAEAKFHWCTPKAREKATNALETLNSVTIPANAKEIEKARAEGDLKENAGYHAAREKHSLLLAQAAELSQAINTARDFDMSKLTTEVVAFGSRFSAANLTSGERETYTVLGRWEADPDHGVISYLTPLMQQFLNKAVGEEFEITYPDGKKATYRIEEITDGLSGTEWA